MRDTVFLTYICVGIILLTSNKFIDVCVAGKRYRLVTLIHCQELVSFTSSCAGPALRGGREAAAPGPPNPGGPL